MLSDLTNYVFRYYAHLMTDDEKRALGHLVTTMKAAGGSSDFAAQEEVQADKDCSRRLSSDPEVLRLASDGFKDFVERTAQRILADQPDKVFLNCCPQCGSLARTPKARQCRVCGNDWHQ